MVSPERTPEWVIEYIFTHPNPDTGSVPPPHVAWVAFENGTMFFSFPSDALRVDASLDDIEAAAKAALQELGQVAPGEASADFSSVHLDTWFPGEYIYLVTYGHRSIANVVQMDGENELVAGLVGRTQRQQDLEALAVRAVRGFGGEKRPGGMG